MKWFKKEDKFKPEVKLPPPVAIAQIDYMGGMIEVTDKDSRTVQANLSKEGEGRLNSLSLDDLIVYMQATVDAYQIQIKFNIVGAGSMSCSKEFLAFQSLMNALAQRLTLKRKEEKENKDASN